MLSSKVCNIFRMGRHTNVKLGIQMEHEDQTSAMTSKVKGHGRSQGYVVRLIGVGP